MRGSFLGLIVVLAAFSICAQTKQVPPAADVRESLVRAFGNPTYTILNINNATALFEYDGNRGPVPSPLTGTYFPKGTANVIYLDGLVLGGKAYTNATHDGPPVQDQRVRVVGGTFGTGMRAGSVVGFGVQAEAENPYDPEVRIFRIRRDHASMSDAELREAAADYYEHDASDVNDNEITEVKNQYSLDWNSWPVSKGAPFIDRNQNGIYEPPPAFNLDPLTGPLFTHDSLAPGGYDEPGVAGMDLDSPADQVIWTVYNDILASETRKFVGSDPLGLEIQQTVWGYRRSTFVDNVYFLRYVIINKGGVDTSSVVGDQLGSFWIDSLYVSLWSDPDLGSFSDDLVGSDSLIQMAYVYNAGPIDNEFNRFALAPPSAGYVLLQGLSVPSSVDSSIRSFHFREGLRNLGMSSFTHFGAGLPNSDPPGGAGNYQPGSGRWWKLLRGFAPLGDFTTSDEHYAHPPGTGITFFPLSGDPPSGTGWIDGMGSEYSFVPGDRRMLITSGPALLAPGDTQEVYFAFVAGLGADHLSSISIAKYHGKLARAMARRSFRVAAPPDRPFVAAYEMDREVVLDWGVDFSQISRTEDVIRGGAYRFEGYNVYEYPSAEARVSEGVRIATFDRSNGLSIVLDSFQDPVSRLLVGGPVQFGEDSGLERSLRITRSVLGESSAQEPLINGKEYYFGVSAYNVIHQGEGVPKSFESDATVVTVKPRIPFDATATTSFGDTVSVTHISGYADGIVAAKIVDPLAGTGETYRISFDGESPRTWTLRIARSDELLIRQLPVRNTDEGFITVHGGMGLMVSGRLPAGLKPGWSWSPASQRFMTYANSSGLKMESFSGAAGWTSPGRIFGKSIERPVSGDSLVNIRIAFAATFSENAGAFDSSNDDTASYAYRFLANGNVSPAQPSFAPWIMNASGGFALQDYRLSMPLAVYNIEVTPPERLAVGYLENNVASGLVDGYYWPPEYGSSTTSNTDSLSPREWLFVFRTPYTGSVPNAGWLDALNDTTMPIMYAMTWIRRNNNRWPDGNSMMFLANHVFTSADTFTYFVPAAKRGQEIESASVNRIGVFPNPYYAQNPWASSSLRPFVTFNNLPPKAIIRIYNLAGHLVRVIRKDTESQFIDWDLRNREGWLVASGIYICHIELPDLNEQKVLKLAIIQENPVAR